MLQAQPSVPGRCNGGEERKTFQYFSESNDKENELQKHFREKRIRETGLGGILVIQYVTLYSFYTWLSNP